MSFWRMQSAITARSICGLVTLEKNCGVSASHNSMSLYKLDASIVKFDTGNNQQTNISDLSLNFRTPQKDMYLCKIEINIRLELKIQ